MQLTVSFDCQCYACLMLLCCVQMQALVLAATALGLVCLNWPLSSGLSLITLAAGFALWKDIVAACRSLRQLVMVTVSWMRCTLGCLLSQAHEMALIMLATLRKVIIDCEVSQAVAAAMTAAGQDWQQSPAMSCGILQACTCSLLCFCVHRSCCITPAIMSCTWRDCKFGSCRCPGLSCASR